MLFFSLKYPWVSELHLAQHHVILYSEKHLGSFVPGFPSGLMFGVPYVDLHTIITSDFNQKCHPLALSRGTTFNMPPHWENLPRIWQQAEVPRPSGHQESLLHIPINASLVVLVIHATWETEVGELLESKKQLDHPEQHSMTLSSIKTNQTPEKKFINFLASLPRKRIVLLNVKG